VFSIETWSRVEIREIFRPFPFPIQWHPMCMHHVFPTSSASWGKEMRSVKWPIQTSTRHLLEADTFHYGRTCCRGQLLRIGCLLCRRQKREVQVNKQAQLKEEVKRWLTIFHHTYKYTAHYINILKIIFAKSSKSQSWVNQNPMGGCSTQSSNGLQLWRNQNRSRKNESLLIAIAHTQMTIGYIYIL